MREGIDRLGLELFAQREVASNTVTAVRVPAGMDVSKLIKGLRERHGVVVAGGQDWLKGRILRIGHMGYVHEEDVEHLLSALASILGEEDLSLAV
jgi:aspartate aminotransferase-like enzyme